MKTVVQKYGGTSLGKADRMLGVAEIVKESLKKRSGHPRSFGNEHLRKSRRNNQQTH